jgi:hypothetical protein
MPAHWRSSTRDTACFAASPDSSVSSLTARHGIQLWILDLLSKRDISLGRRSAKLHVALYRQTRGRVGSRLPRWHQARILLIDRVGAKSGAKRTSPVIYCEHGDGVAVVGSKAGQPTNPACFHNLQATRTPPSRSAPTSAASAPESRPTRSGTTSG